MEVRSDAFESAKSNLFDTSSWGDFCDVTLTLRQGHQPDSGGWVKTDDYRCRHAFRHFMNLLNRAAYGSAFRRHGKRLRVLPVLEKGELRAPRTTFMGAWCVNRSMAYSLCNRIALALRCCCPRKLDPRLLGEGRVELRQNSCPRRCKRGLDQLHVERPSKVGIRRFS
jgi:hypothetical protein